MTSIRYLTGDATTPAVEGNKLICHVCNDVGGWGKGFVLALSKRWPQPEAAFRQWYRDRENNDFALGAVQFVQVEPEVWVANMVGQHGLKHAGGKPPIRYEAVEAALGRVADEAARLKASVHMPRIGCGLAGGTWDRIEPLIDRTLCGRGVEVFVYDLG
jgi:O-acetyl-ADP-ribose deacetylase (regulator of RNase III)